MKAHRFGPGFVLLIAQLTGCSTDPTQLQTSPSALALADASLPDATGSGSDSGSGSGDAGTDFGKIYVDTDGNSNSLDDEWPHTPGCVIEYENAGCSGENLVVFHDYCGSDGLLHEGYTLRFVLQSRPPDPIPRGKWFFCGPGVCCERHGENTLDCDNYCRLTGFIGGGCITVETDCGHGYCSCVI